MCEATGYPPPMITWYKNDHVMDERKIFRKRTLRFSEIQFEDRGIYTCKAENLLGSVQFSVNLTVQVAAKFLQKPEISMTTYKTWDTTLLCDIFGYPAPVISWSRSHKDLPVNRHVISGNELKIMNTTEDDGGAYVCQGANHLGNVMAVTWVVVKDVVNPYIISSPSSEILVQKVGDYVKLNCSSSGSPLPKAQWLKDGKVFSEAGYNTIDLTMSELIIPSFKPRDMGLYTCRFYNNKNSTVEASTNLGLVNCGNPGSPSEGQMIGSRFWTGEAVSFVCNPGYHLIGPSSRLCLPSGNWSGIQPECRLKGAALLDHTGHLSQKVLPAGYGDYSAYDIGWYAFHFAASAACRGSTPKGGSGYNVNVVFPQPHGKSCNQICSQNKMQCTAQLNISGMGKETREKKAVGSFYNYGCTATGGWHDEFYKGINIFYVPASRYIGYCCCK
ncbi:hypothetical protein ACROYT_G041454 [Oculina patagonica]